MSPRVVNKEEKRCQILRAALKVFARQGVGDFKMIEIARQAEVGKGTLYEYFPSKEKLIAGSFSLFVEDFARFVENRMISEDNPAEKIKKLIGATCSFYIKEKRNINLMFDLWGVAIANRRGKQALLEMEGIYTDTIKWLAGIIEDGIKQGLFNEVDTELAAAMILATLDGLAFQVALGITRIDNEEIFQNISNIILGGLLK
jgi:TetR/AcrR family fatty acid metabolism transcriptional regulator